MRQFFWWSINPKGTLNVYGLLQTSTLLLSIYLSIEDEDPNDAGSIYAPDSDLLGGIVYLREDDIAYTDRTEEQEGRQDSNSDGTDGESVSSSAETDSDDSVSDDERQERLLDVRIGKRKANKVPVDPRPTSRKRTSAESHRSTSQQHSALAKIVLNTRTISRTTRAKQHKAADTQRSTDLAINEYPVELELQATRHSNLAASTENICPRYQMHWRVTPGVSRQTRIFSILRIIELHMQTRYINYVLPFVFLKAGAPERDTETIWYSRNDSRFTCPRIWRMRQMTNGVSIRSESSKGGGGRMHPVPIKKECLTRFLHTRPWMLTSKPRVIYTKPSRSLVSSSLLSLFCLFPRSHLSRTLDYIIRYIILLLDRSSQYDTSMG
jgi:hypothetical protein